MESNHYSEAPCFMNIPSGFYQLELMAPCVESSGIEPERYALVIVNLMSADFTPQIKMSSLMTCSGPEPTVWIVYGHIQVGL
mgnify:CR=1 FL=1